MHDDQPIHCIGLSPPTVAWLDGLATSCSRPSSFVLVDGLSVKGRYGLRGAWISRGIPHPAHSLQPIKLIVSL